MSTDSRVVPEAVFAPFKLFQNLFAKQYRLVSAVLHTIYVYNKQQKSKHYAVFENKTVRSQIIVYCQIFCEKEHDFRAFFTGFYTMFTKTLFKLTSCKNMTTHF